MMSAEDLFNMGQATAREAGSLADSQSWSELDSDIQEWMAIFAARINERTRQAEAAAREEERERCAMLHENVNPASDEERLNNVPGAGAMGAVIEYRDAIRAS